MKSAAIQPIPRQQPRGRFLEGLGAEPRRVARRPHVEAPASLIANPAQVRAPPGTKAGPLPLPNIPQKVP